MDKESRGSERWRVATDSKMTLPHWSNGGGWRGLSRGRVRMDLREACIYLGSRGTGSVDLFTLSEGISEGQLCVQLCARYQGYGGQIHI